MVVCNLILWLVLYMVKLLNHYTQQILTVKIVLDLRNCLHNFLIFWKIRIIVLCQFFWEVYYLCLINTLILHSVVSYASVDYYDTKSVQWLPPSLLIKKSLWFFKMLGCLLILWCMHVPLIKLYDLLVYISLEVLCNHDPTS